MAIIAIKPQPPRRLSAELEELIRDAIRTGQLRPGQKLGTAKQLAKQWDTSYSVVRQSLETLAAKGVLERRPRAGTFVSSNAQEVTPVAVGHRGIIGLLVPDIRMPEYGAIARHLQDAGQKANFEVLVSSTDNERARYDLSVMRHLQAGVGGLVLVSPQQARISLQTLLELEKSGVPVVNYARTIDVAPWATVQTDILQGMYLPVKHVCELGRRHLGVLSYTASDTHRTQQRCGLFSAMAEHGLLASDLAALELPASLYTSGWGDRQALQQVLSDWLDQNPKIDAICCTHDHIASAMLSVLQQRGKRAPEDVAVTGMGVMGEAYGLAPGALTTVDTCLDKAAEEIVRLLQLTTEEGKRTESPESQVVKIQPRLVLGRSSVGEAGMAQANTQQSV